MRSKRNWALPFAVAAAYAMIVAAPMVFSTTGLPTAAAYPSYVAAIKTAYPSTTIDSRLSCTICHTPQGFSSPVNCYKRDLANLGSATPIASRIAMLNAVDSDGDGVANGAELTAVRPGGGVGFSPGLIGSNGTDPCGSNASTAVTSVCETPLDSDNDGTIDCNDGCPNDPNKTSAGACGCGAADVDSDGDGVLDCNDACPGVNDSLDANGNGLPDCLEGATFTVNTTNDTIDADTSDGVCADANGQCSLRAAVMQANAQTDSNTIILPAGTYVLSLHGAGVGDISGDLNVIESVNILGAGADSTIVDGDAADGVFDLGSYQSVITISGVTIRNGLSTSFPSGGVYSLDNNLTLTDCAIIENNLQHPSAYGGGLMCGGTLTMSNCLIANNTTTASSGGAGFGGGVCLYYGGTSTLTNCTISENSLSGGGGPEGGGIAVLGNNATLNNCTIVNNTCVGATGGVYFDSASTRVLTITNSIVANNTGLANCLGTNYNNSTITSGGNNIDDTDSCNFHAVGDLVNTDPRLGSLADNGGRTRTHALASDSPAIDAGNAAICSATDQRDFSRPADGNNDGTAACDIGAVEFSDCNQNGTDDGADAANGSPLPDCDNDGIPDACELGEDCNQNGVPDSCEADADADGVIDDCDPCPNSSNNADSDGDGTPDCNDGCPNDAAKIAPGGCGCGNADDDTDGDGVADCVDVCPEVTNPDQIDSDNDGRGDDCDAAPFDSTVGGATDSDGDGSPDNGDFLNGEDSSAEAGTDLATDSSTCGSGVACGAGMINMLGVTLLGMLLMKRGARQ